MIWEPDRWAGGSHHLLHREAARRHLDAARDLALAGDLDAAVDALRDLQALQTELREQHAVVGVEHDA
jgi:hypothetical protein